MSSTTTSPPKITNGQLLGLDTFGKRGENSFLKFLKEAVDNSGNQFTSRQIFGAHYTKVQPESVPAPELVAASSSCAESLGLDPTEIDHKKEQFARIFSGNELAPGLDVPYCSIYGCHCYGTWFGQLGDGRAMALGEVTNGRGERFELQLKGCGRSPFSRGFDGRAVLRSSVREFLVSELMHHLRVPTTRALSLVATGMKIRRPWYAPTAQLAQAAVQQAGGQQPFAADRFSPDRVIMEPGAVVCRVAPSFLRVAQLELFAMRKEFDELVQLANFACVREFPYLLSEYPTVDTNLPPPPPSTSTSASSASVDSPPLSMTTEQAVASLTPDQIKIPGPAKRYVEMFRCAARGNARLVAEWLRVGYTQGNMNSDNTLLAGRTLDYGPYGWVEQYDPNYQPFTSDTDGKFAFAQQPQAMAVNMLVLAERTIIPLVQYCCQQAKTDKETEAALVAEVAAIAQKEFNSYFWGAYTDIIARKLGLYTSSFGGQEDMALWTDLHRLLEVTKVDFVIFFRLLALVADAPNEVEAWRGLSEACYDQRLYDMVAEHLTDPSPIPAPTPSSRSKVTEVGDTENDASNSRPAIPLSEAWASWLRSYLHRIRTEGRDPATRRREQDLTNPKYVLRNWMAVLASEQAAQGDPSLVHELQELFLDPYGREESEGEGGRAKEERRKQWFQKTPVWARQMPGCEFFSCSS